MRLSLIHTLKSLDRPTINHIPSAKGLHWIVVAASLVATLVAWQVSLHNTRERILIKFDRQADYAVNLFSEQMNRYADMLKSGVGYAAGTDEIRPDEWREFTRRLELEQQFPAISGIGLVYRVETDEIDEFVRKQRVLRPDFRVYPEVNPESADTRNYVLPITLISPDELAENVTGLDVAREERRRHAIERSIATGNVQITAPIRPDALGEPGFVLIAPIFETNRPATEALRQSQFIGAVVAAVITENLAQGILERGIRQVALRVSDDGETMYNELLSENNGVDPQPLITSSRVVPFFGRDWQFDIHSTLSFRVDSADAAPTMILAGGLIIDGLLMLLFLHMSRTNQKATEFAQKISGKYRLQSEQLRTSNKKLEERNGELEAFSYLVSHDLKTPLRGVGFLADCITEDLEEHQPGNPLPADIIFRMTRIKKQVTLAQGLIHGVLQYSGLGIDKEMPEEVNMMELLNSVRMMLTVDEAQLKLTGEFPTFTTYRTQLTQVLMNLIGNGYKYHPDPQLALVTVGIEASSLTDYYRFTVSDNGQGIDETYHQKIFEPFFTLQPKDQSMSSGVGLAIVKKLVTRNGGKIEITSEMGKGTCFSVDWPRSVTDIVDTDEEESLPRAA